jgi:hypothetical protein
MNGAIMREKEIEEFIAIRRRAGLVLDPETAEVVWWDAPAHDPYKVHPHRVPEAQWQVGREYLARAPGFDLWVHFDDLPVATSTALWEKHGHWLADPFKVSIEESEQ